MGFFWLLGLDIAEDIEYTETEREFEIIQANCGGFGNNWERGVGEEELANSITGFL